MSFGLDRTIAESVVRALDSNQKIIAFFDKINEKTEKLQKEIEQKLENISALESAINPNDAMKKISLDTHDLVNLLRATELAMSRRHRKVMRKVITLIETFKTISDENKSLIALKKLMQLVKVVYIALIDEHIQMNAHLKLQIMKAIAKITNETTEIYRRSLERHVDSGRTKSILSKLGAGEEDKDISSMLGEGIEL